MINNWKSHVYMTWTIVAIGKNGDSVQLKRPLQRLFPIELQSEKKKETEFHAGKENMSDKTIYIKV